MTFAELYELEMSSVRKLIYGKVRDMDLASDLTQDTFVRALAAWDRFVPRAEIPNSHRAWLFRIAKNVTYDYFRDLRERYSHVSLSSIDGAPVERNFFVSPSFELASAEALDLRSAWSKLQPKYRKMIAEAALSGLNDKQLAEKHGVTYTTMRKRVHDARVKLRQLL